MSNYCMKCDGSWYPRNQPLMFAGKLCVCEVPTLEQPNAFSVLSETNILRDRIEHLSSVADMWKRMYADECRKNAPFDLFKWFRR